jgi:hypothetical protein
MSSFTRVAAESKIALSLVSDRQHSSGETLGCTWESKRRLSQRRGGICDRAHRLGSLLCVASFFSELSLLGSTRKTAWLLPPERQPGTTQCSSSTALRTNLNFD